MGSSARGAGVTERLLEWLSEQEASDEARDSLMALAQGALQSNDPLLRHLLRHVIRGADLIVGTDDNDSIAGTDGDDVIDGLLGADTMSGGTGDDTYIVDDAGDEAIEQADEGIDTVLAGVDYTLADNLENLVLTGAAITGIGNALDNQLSGNGNDNLLDGGAGADTMSGGMGDDTYLVDDAGDVVTEQADEGDDTVVASIDYTLGAALERLVLDGGADLSGTGNELDNFLQGNTGANLLAGLDGNDTLVGAEGDDTLNGGTGADSMAGGLGDDRYMVDDAGDSVAEGEDEGDDTVVASIDYTLGQGLEDLVLTGGADLTGTGNGADNRLKGNSGANMLDGAAGADTLIGGEGDDLYRVDDAGDVVTELADEGVDTVQASIDWTLGDEVENLVLTGAALAGTGNALDNGLQGNGNDNLLAGLGGDDTLDGGEGNDTLDGGAGADAMAGGLGDDRYLVDDAGDSVTELDGEGRDTVVSTVDYVLGLGVEDLVLAGAALAGTGNDADNLLQGNRGANTLDGGAGADTLQGGDGDDLYLVDDLGDVVEEQASEGADSVSASVSYTLAANIENLILLGSAGLSGTGNASSNLLQGNSGNNALSGLDGNDTLDGGGGTDTMTGGVGDDTYIVDTTDDKIVELTGGGMDSVLASASFTLSSQIENLTLVGSAALNGTGNSLGNMIVGNSGSNSLSGVGGDDYLDGAAGNDSLDGGVGADVLDGGAGNDRLLGSDGNDTLYDEWNEGGPGVADTIDGGLGNDTLWADWSSSTVGVNWTNSPTVSVTVNGNLISGIEALTLRLGSGADVVNNTNVTTDDQIWGGGGNDKLNGGVGYDFLYGEAGNDTLLGGSGSDGDMLDGGIGNDSLDGGAGFDNLYGGDGADTLKGGTGVFSDWLYGDAGNDSLDGGDGFDYLYGGDGDDTLVANIGGGFLSGDLGNDTLTGGTGSEADSLDGGDGNDNLNAGAGNDTLFDEWLGQPVGTDTIDGGLDTDALYADWSSATNAITWVNNPNVAQSVNGNSLIHIEGMVLYLGSGNDVISNAATSTADQIWSGDGNDSLDGGAGADSLYGGNGNDTLRGSNGTDALAGEAGTDSLDGGSGNDRLDGGDGNDTLLGSTGSDTLSGGAGSDTLTGGPGSDAAVADQFGLNSLVGSDLITDFRSGVDKLAVSRAGLPIGDGDLLVEGATTIAGSGGFSASAELVVCTGNIAGAISAASAAAEIGSASNAYAVGQTALFVVDNGTDTAVYYFKALDADSTVDAGELTLLTTLSGCAQTAVTDYLWGA